MSTRNFCVFVAGAILLLWMTTQSRAANYVVDPSLTITAFAGAAAGGPDVTGAKFSVITYPNGPFGDNMFVSNIGGNNITEISPSGTVTTNSFLTGTLPYSGLGGMDVDGTVQNIQGNTKGLYSGSGAMYVVNVSGGSLGGGIYQVSSSGTSSLFSAAGVVNPKADLVFDRTPGFKYGGFMYVSLYGGGATDGIYKISPSGSASPFVSLANRDPRYFAFDTTGTTGYGGGGLMWAESYGSGTIFSITPSGTVNLPLATLAPGAEGIAFGQGDAYFGPYLYPGNLLTGDIMRVAPNGVSTLFAHIDTPVGATATDLQFVSASSPFAIGGNPTLYVDEPGGGGSVFAISVSPHPNLPPSRCSASVPSACWSTDGEGESRQRSHTNHWELRFKGDSL